jgi:phosphate transport system substrate-binding protein
MAAKQGLRGALIAGLILGGAAVAHADAVTLKVKDGSFEISGDLVSTDGKTIALNSPTAGLIVLEARRFDCVGEGCKALASNDNFSIQGSNTIGAALMPALVESFATSQNLRVEKRVGASAEEVGMDLLDPSGGKVGAVDLRSHGSGTAFPALAKGEAEIGASSRPIKPEEEKLLTDAGLGIDAHVLALDGILVLVSPDNPVGELTLDQIGGIFSGQITDWSQVGAPPGPITVFARDEKSGTTDTFKSLVLQPRNLQFAPSATRMESSVELSDDVAGDPKAIGFVGFAYLRNAKALSIRTVCGMSYAPTQFNVKTEEYPLARRLFLYTTSKASSERAKALLDYTLTDPAQQTILATGFIDQTFDYLPFQQQAYRIAFAFSEATDEFNMDSMKQLVMLIGDAKRMSATFRLEKNEYQLDLKAKQDAVRLAHALETPELQGKDIMLIGFADSAGPFASNLTVSQARAETVRSAVLTAAGKKLDPKRLTAKGFSETLPVDCNGTLEGRAKNRRVEVWIRDQGTASEPQPSASGKPGGRQPAATGSLPPKTGQQPRAAGQQSRAAQTPRAAQQAKPQSQ